MIIPHSCFALSIHYKDDDKIDFKMLGKYYRIPHGEMVEMAKEHSTYLDTVSWNRDGIYNSKNGNPAIRDACKPYAR